MEKLRRIFGLLDPKAKTVEAWWSLGKEVWNNIPTPVIWVISGAAGIIGAALMSAFQYIQSLGWGGLVLAIVAGYFIAMTAALLWVRLSIGILTRSRAKTAPGSGENAPTHSLSRGTEPTPFNPLGLYVGVIRLTTSAIADQNTVEISAKVFNASGRAIDVRRVTGAITARIQRNDQTTDVGALPTPWLVENLEQMQGLEPLKEHLILLEQRLTPPVREALMALQPGDSVSFDLDGLDVAVEPQDRSAQASRLPLWNGIMLRRPLQDIEAGRIINARVGMIGVTTGGG